FGEERVETAIKRIFDYVFAKFKYPGIPQMKLTQIDNNPFFVDDIKIISIRGFHHKLPVFGFRIGGFAYMTDINKVELEEKKKLNGLKVLIVNALRKEKHISHYNLKQALQLIDELQPEKAYLTHISHQMGFYKEVSIELPSNVFLAFDGLKITI
ncbi:MAG: MBL fold metallo-hydrolase, partial [Mariniphaga sp.]|nr:MBL fold metallo-hydrolase [Mariniphaga sp.]